jgi:biotin transport system substrate-specific component
MTHYRAARLRHWLPHTSSPLATRLEQVAWVVGAAVTTAVSAQVSVTLPGSPVPFTLQPVAVMLSGIVLGARLGAASQLTYLALGIAGASAFAWSPVLLPGVARLVGPTGGFLLAFPLAALVCGALAARAHSPRALTTAAAMLAGTAVLHAIGWTWAFATLPGGVGPGTMAPFLAADAIKMLVAAPLAARLVRT